MKNQFTYLFVFLSLLVGSKRALAQACTTGCNFTAVSGGSYNLNGNQLLCFNASNPNVTNINGNFNGSNNQICVATGVTWTQTNSLNLNSSSFSTINIFGTTTFTGGGNIGATTINIPGSANLSGNVSLAANTITVNGSLNLTGGSIGAAVVTINGSANLTGVSFNSTTLNVSGTGSLTLNANSNINGTTSVNVASGGTLQTNVTNFPSNFRLTNAGSTTFTSSSNVEFTGTFTNAAGATVTATAPSLLKFGSGATVVNAGTMNVSNLENSDVNQLTNQSTGIIRVNRSFYNHGGFLNDGLVRTLCATNSSGSAPCEFRTGDKGAKTFVSNSCMIVAGAVTFDGPATLNGTLEILPGYDLNINKIVTGSNGYLIVGGGTSTIGIDGRYTGSVGANSMKFYDANTGSHDFDAKNNPNFASVYTVLPAAPVTSCSATAGCSVSVAVTSTTCQTATNQYVLTGTVSFSNTGGSTITIQDGAASTTVSTTGTSPQAFTLTGANLVSNASSHTITAASSTSACSTTATAIYNSPASCLAISVNSTTVCAGQTATLTATGCIGSVTWSGGLSGTSINIVTSSTITAQTVLSYTATCTSGPSTATAVGTITVIPNAVTPTITVVQPTCSIPTGSITASSAGANSFTLTNGVTPTVNGTGIFTGLAPGSYTITAGNGTTCTSAASTTTIVANPGTPGAPTLTVVQPTCTTPTGSLTANSPGATSFTLTDGVTPVVNGTGIFTGLAPNSYTIIAGNASCSSAGSPTVIIANPGTPVAPTLTVAQPDCSTPTGSVTAVSAGATSFTLTNGVTPIVNGTGIFTGLAPGSYTVTAGNASCSSAGSPTTIIANPGTPAAPTLTVVQPTCTTPTGGVTAVSAGATSFTLTNGVTPIVNGTGIFTGLAPGSYTVTAGNASCSSGGSTTSIQDAPIVPVAPIAVATCSSATGTTGSITVSSPAEGPGITFSVNGGAYQVSSVFATLGVGVYTVTVQQNGCISLPTSVTINECPMPVNLASFTGKWVEGVGNQLSWSTVWERNNNYFEIQRSAVAKSFESIGRVNGKGTTSTTQTYQFADAQPVSDISYYRLKQVDTDGTTHYSQIIAVEKGVLAGVNLEMYPNPTSSELNLRLKAGQTIGEVNVYNSSGHRVLHQTDTKSVLQVNSLSGGVYTIEVKTSTGQILRQRFIKQ